MSGAADLMPRIEQARNGHQRAEELLSEARGMLSKPEEQAPKPEEGGGWLDKLKGAGHTVLDAAGFIPVVGAAADLANAAWYAAEGDYTNAAFSAASAVPGVGDAFAAGKVAVKVAGATGGVAAAAAFGRRVTNAADTATDAADTVTDATKIAPGSVDDLLKGATLVKDSKTIQYAKPGGFNQANKEFDQFTEGLSVKQHPGGIRSTTLDDGSKVGVRPHSSYGEPTIQIDPPKGTTEKTIKVRYEE